MSKHSREANRNVIWVMQRECSRVVSWLRGFVVVYILVLWNQGRSSLLLSGIKVRFSEG